MSEVERALVALIRSGQEELDIDPFYAPQMATVSVEQVAKGLTLFVRAAGLFPVDQRPTVRPLAWSAIHVDDGPHDAALYVLECKDVSVLYFSVSQTLVRRVNGKA